MAYRITRLYVVLDDINDVIHFLVSIANEHVQRDLPEIRIPRNDSGVHIQLILRRIRELAQYPLMPAPEHNQLLCMLAWNADYWSFTLNASGESMDIAFYPMYSSNYRPPAVHDETSSESSADDEQPGPSHLVNNGEVRPGGSRTAPDQSSGRYDSLGSGCSSSASPGDTSSSNRSAGRQIETRRAVKRKRENSSSLESRERKRSRLDPQSDSMIDSLTDAFSRMYITTPPPAACEETPLEVSSEEEQPGPSHRAP